VNRLSLDNISISNDKLNELCNNYTDMLGSKYVAFSIDFAPNEALYENSNDHNNAVIQRRYLVLVLCNVTEEQHGTYTCVAPATDSSAKSEKIMDIDVIDEMVVIDKGGTNTTPDTDTNPGGTDTNPGTKGGTNTNPGAIAGVVVAALAIVCMMVLDLDI
jgi:hypothetical protein